MLSILNGLLGAAATGYLKPRILIEQLRILTDDTPPYLDGQLGHFGQQIGRFAFQHHTQAVQLVHRDIDLAPLDASHIAAVDLCLQGQLLLIDACYLALLPNLQANDFTEFAHFYT